MQKPHQEEKKKISLKDGVKPKEEKEEKRR